MDAQSRLQTKPTVATIVLLSIAGVCYLGMLGSLFGLNRTNAAGRDLALEFGDGFGAALWLVLAVLMTAAAVNGRMPTAGKIGAAILLPTSAIAAWVAVDLYGSNMTWAFAIVIALPVLIAAYALWARMTALQAMLPPDLATVIAGGAIALLTLAPFVGATFAAVPTPERQATVRTRDEALRREEDASLKREAEQFAQLGPDSSLADYLRYLPGGDSRSQQALAGARQVKSRQADAVSLLKAGRLEALTDLFRLDLQATPELCSAYGAALGTAAARVSKERPDYLSVAIDLEQQMPNLQWLVQEGCNLNTSLGLLVANLHAASDTERMDIFANHLSILRR